jgi:hypothetical protein
MNQHSGAQLRRIHRLVDFSVLRKPLDIATLSSFLYLAQQLNGLGFETRFARIIRRNDQFDLHRHDIAIGPNQFRASHAFSGKLHDICPSKK